MFICISSSYVLFSFMLLIILVLNPVHDICVWKWIILTWAACGWVRSVYLLIMLWNFCKFVFFSRPSPAVSASISLLVMWCGDITDHLWSTDGTQNKICDSMSLLFQLYYDSITLIFLAVHIDQGFCFNPKIDWADRIEIIERVELINSTH